MFKFIYHLLPSVRRRDALVARLRREIAQMKAPKLLPETDGSGELIVAGRASYTFNLRGI